jgi:hypothetical protein
MRKILTVLSLILLTSMLFGQSAKKAGKLLAAGDFNGAASMYEKLLENDPNNGDYNMNLGKCYIQTPGRETLAVPHLEKAVELFGSKKESKEFIDSKFLLGLAYHAIYEFDNAIRVYNELVINSAFKKFQSVDILQNEIRACEAAKEELKKQKLHKVESPGDMVNTEFTQHSPFFAEDAGVFIYTSKELTEKFGDKKMDDGEYNENIFFVYIENENDREADPYDEPLNSDDNEANCWMSKDGNYMLLYKDGDIYRSSKSGGKWTKPKKFKEISSSADESHACMNQAMDMVYFSSDRGGGPGGKDIFYSKRSKDGKWSDPKPLGKTINTKFDEESPYIHEDGTLYFSSKGHNSIGGYDIFSAVGSSPTRFEEAVNLGIPVNSVKDDAFFMITQDKKTGYFMSKRPEGKGRADIYKVSFSDASIQFLLVEGFVNNQINTMNSVKIFKVSNRNKAYDAMHSNSEKFSANVDRNENYFISFNADDHYFEASTFSAPYDENKVKNLGTKSLEPINFEEVHKAYSMNFGNLTTIDNVNYLFLITLVDFLNQNQNFGINISSSLDKEDPDVKERKQNIEDMLVVSGISEDRIFIDMFSYDELQSDIVVTVLDKNALTPVSDNNVNEVTQPGNFTIQLGAFERKIPNNHRFFKDFKGKVIIRDADDGLYRYTIGAYSSESEAEQELLNIQSKGFNDAFVRAISWYK